MPSAVVHGEKIWLFAPYAYTEQSNEAIRPQWAVSYCPATGAWARAPWECLTDLKMNSGAVIIDGRVYFTDFGEGENRLPKARYMDLKKATGEEARTQ